MTGPRAGVALLYAATLLGAFTAAVSALTYFDIWWILKSGQLIVATGTVPRADPFSYTAAGRPWINHMWATQALFFLLWRAGGSAALILAKGAAVTATLAILLRLCRARGVHPVLAAGTTLFVAWAGTRFWEVRPQVVTYLLTALYLWLLREGWERRRRLWLWVPGLMVPWANLHAGFLTGLGTIALVAVGTALPRLVEPASRPEGWAIARRGAGLLALAALASLVNPFGVAAYRFPLELMGTRAFMAATAEWFSPSFHNPSHRGFEAMLLLLVPAFAWGRARLGATDIVLMLTWLHLALVSLRHIPLFLLVAAPPLADALQAILRDWGHRLGSDALLAEARRAMPTFAPHARSPRVHLAAATLVILLGVGGTWAALAPRAVNPFVLDLNERRYPERAMTFVLQESLPAPLFNVYAWGGFELWRLYPRYRVFMDGRTHVYGAGVLRDYLEVAGAGRGWRQVLDRWGVQTLILLRGAPLVQLIEATGGWRPVFAEREVAIYVREVEGNRRWTDRLPAVAVRVR